MRAAAPAGSGAGPGLGWLAPVPPRLWASGAWLPLVGTAGFDGRGFFAFTEQAVLHVDSDRATTLYDRAPHAVSALRLGPDRSHLAWIERTAEGPRAMTAPASGTGSPRPVCGAGSCLAVAWTAPEELAVLETRGTERRARPITLTLCALDGTRGSPLLSTVRIVWTVASDPAARHVYVGGRGLLTGPTAAEIRAEVEVRAEGEAAAAVWRVRLDGGEPARCLANLAAAEPPLPVDGGCLYVASGASPVTSAVVLAGAFGCRATRVPALVQRPALAPGGRHLLYRAYGERGAIRQLSIAPLLDLGPDGGSS